MQQSVLLISAWKRFARIYEAFVVRAYCIHANLDRRTWCFLLSPIKEQILTSVILWRWQSSYYIIKVRISLYFFALNTFETFTDARLLKNLTKVYLRSIYACYFWFVVNFNFFFFLNKRRRSHSTIRTHLALNRDDNMTVIPRENRDCDCYYRIECLSTFIWEQRLSTKMYLKTYASKKPASISELAWKLRALLKALQTHYSSYWNINSHLRIQYRPFGFVWYKFVLLINNLKR